jgi:hypothetical protein
MSENALTSKQLRSALTRCIDTKRPAFIWGPPGIGKSDLIAQITKEKGGHMIDLRMGQLDPMDLRGIPVPNKETGTMEFYPLGDLPTKELAEEYPLVVLFLDELTSAPPSVLAAGYQLVLDRKIGKYELPDNVVVIAAGNRDSDKGVTFRMPTPLANRFTHFEMRTDFDSWFEWAIEHRIHKDIVGFLSFSKKDLYDFDPKQSGRVFATPRSWTFTSELISGGNIDDTTMKHLIAGTVGEGMAISLMAYRKISGKLPNPVDVLNGRVMKLDTDEASAMYSLTISMCYELQDFTRSAAYKEKNGDDVFHDMCDNFFRFMMENFDKELVIMGARVAIKTYNLPINTTKLNYFDEFYDRFGHYIVNVSKN